MQEDIFESYTSFFDLSDMNYFNTLESFETQSNEANDINFISLSNTTLPERPFCLTRIKRRIREVSIWTKEEEELLKQLNQKHPRNWRLISKSFEDKMPRQCAYHYDTIITNKMQKKKFKRIDDIQLLELINTMNWDWPVIQRKMPRFTITQLKNRFKWYLFPKIQKDKRMHELNDIYYEGACLEENEKSKECSLNDSEAMTMSDKAVEHEKIKSVLDNTMKLKDLFKELHKENEKSLLKMNKKTFIKVKNQLNDYQESLFKSLEKYSMNSNETTLLKAADVLKIINIQSKLIQLGKLNASLFHKSY